MNRIKHKIYTFNKFHIKPWLRHAVGLDELEDNIYTFLNSVTDITQCRPATGILRTLQLADTELLKIVDLICRKNKLVYWLDWGTLLGAVRHKGFIPWDDDLDICLPIDDFKKLYPILKDFCSENSEFILSGTDILSRGVIWINYRTTGTHLDIYPIERCSAAKDATDAQIRQKVTEYWSRGYDSTDAAADPGDGYQPIYYYSKATWGKTGYFRSDDIFPLQETGFEDYSFFVPNDTHTYLSTIYGDYMSYPRRDVLKHSLLRECASTSENGILDADYESLKQFRISLEESLRS